MQRAAIYARYSSDNQREESIDAQIRAIEEFCKRNKYRIVRTYTDEALSARTDDRPQFIEMINDSKDKLFDVVICHKLDRFARNRYDSAFYKKKLAENNVRLISALENLDDSPESIILESVLEGMNEYYSANLSREVKKGMKENALSCLHTVGKPPFGFDVNKDKEYILNKHEAKAVKRIFSMVAKHDTIGNIVKWLDNNGCTTKYGTKFTSGSINAIVRNEKYKGTYVYGKNKRITQGGVQKNVPGDVIRIEDGIPRIVDDETWKSANKIYDARKHKSGGRAKAKETYLLSGLIECGLCGEAMCGDKSKSGRNKTLRITYICNTRKAKKTCNMKSIKRDLVETIVIEELDDILSQTGLDNLVGGLMKKIKEMSTEIPGELKGLKRKLPKIESQIDSLVDAIAEGLYSPSIKEKLEALELQKQDVVDKIGFLEERMELVKLPDKEYIYNFFKQDMNIKDKTDKDKKRIIKTYVKKVVVCPDYIKVHTNLDNQKVGRGYNGSRFSSISYIHILV